MSNFNIIKESDLGNSFRVKSVMNRFDLIKDHSKETFKGEIKLDCDWQIGLIYGHSGTGKTTIAKH